MMNKSSEELLIGIEPMIWSILQNYVGILKEDKEDLKQEVMIYIWNKVIPQYDEERGAKFSSFAYRCVVNFVNRKLYTKNRKKINYTNAIDAIRNTRREFHEEEIGITAEKLKLLRELVSKEGGPFKEREKIVMTMMINRPSITQKEIADTLEYRHPSAVSMMMSRIRRKIKKILKDHDM